MNSTSTSPRITKKNYHKGYVFEVLTLFFLVLFLVVGLGIVLMVSHGMSTAIHASSLANYTIANGTQYAAWYDTNVVANVNALDFMVPMMVGFMGVFIITSAYSSQSPASYIVLFLLMAIVCMIIIHYISGSIETFWDIITATDASITWPYTTLVIENIAPILAVILVLTGIAQHSRPQAYKFK